MWIVNWTKQRLFLFVVIEYDEQLFEVQKCLLTVVVLKCLGPRVWPDSCLNQKVSFWSKFNLNLLVTWTSVDPVTEVDSAGGNRMGLYTDRLSKLIKRMNNFYIVNRFTSLKVKETKREYLHKFRMSTENFQNLLLEL